MGLFRNRWPAGPATSLVDDQAERLVPSLRALRAEHVASLERELHVYNMIQCQVMLDTVGFIPLMLGALPSIFPTAIDKAGSGDGGVLPYRVQIADGAHRLATRKGARTVIGRCGMAAVGEYEHHGHDPQVMAQWLTFYELSALACGPSEHPMPVAFYHELAAGLSTTIAALGVVPVLRPA